MRYFSILSLFLVVALGCDGDTSREVTSSVIGEVVEHTKGVATGIEQGIHEGRENVEGSSGATTVTNAEAIHEKAEFEVESVTVAGNVYTCVIAVTNKTESPLHIGNLDGENNIVAIDESGFATTLSGRTRSTVQIPSDAKVRHSLIFEGENQPAKVRIFGHEYEVPAPAADQAVQAPEAAE